MFMLVAGPLLVFAAAAPRAPSEPHGASPAVQGRADDLQQVSDDFRAATAGSQEERCAALERLIALEDAEVVLVLQAEFAQVSTRLRDTRDSLLRDRYALDHQRRVYERMKLQVAQDSTLEESLAKQEKRVTDLADQVERGKAKVADLEPWYRALGEGSGRFFAALADAKRRKVEKELWAETDGEAAYGVRLAAVELLGYAGTGGTALALAELVADLGSETAKLSRELPKEMAELRKLEQRWQKEMDQMGGRSSPATQDQYDRAKQRAAELQRTIGRIAHLAAAAAESGARALLREDPETLEKSIPKLLQAQEQVGDAERRRILAMLAGSQVESARAGLRARLAAGAEPGARAAMIDALAASGDGATVPLLLDGLVEDPSWNVRSSAVAALARLRVRDAIPVLIERLAKEDGRLRSDVREALVSLTGRDFHGNVELWRRFWQEHGEGFVVPQVGDAEEPVREEAEDSTGVAFFGIETESRGVLFVLDLSRSMTFSMLPRRHPNDEDPDDPDLPGEGEASRLTAAKNALTKALAGIEDGSVFNLVFYATDVWTWQDRLVEMDAEVRAEAMRYVEALDANGGTNIYGALQMALDLAGAVAGEKWIEPKIDTIYFLSDGRASLGVTNEAEEILTLVRERNSSAGIVIHTIGLSGAQDSYLLRVLAEQNGGTYVSR